MENVMAPEGPGRVARDVSPWKVQVSRSKSPGRGDIGQLAMKMSPLSGLAGHAAPSSRASRPWLHDVAPPGPQPTIVTLAHGELQSPRRRGQVHVFGLRLTGLGNICWPKNGPDPDFAVPRIDQPAPLRGFCEIERRLQRARARCYIPTPLRGGATSTSYCPGFAARALAEAVAPGEIIYRGLRDLRDNRLQGLRHYDCMFTKEREIIPGDPFAFGRGRFRPRRLLEPWRLVRE